MTAVKVHSLLPVANSLVGVEILGNIVMTLVYSFIS